MTQKIKRTIGYILALAIIVFLVRVLYQTWGDLTATGFRFEFDFPKLVTSLILLVVARAFAMEAWRQILFSLGEKIPVVFGLRAWFVANLAKYIPGNVWQVATMMAMVERHGVSKTNALLSQIVYTSFALAIAGLLGLMFVVIRPEILNGLIDPSIASYAPIIAAIAFTILVVILAMPITNRLIVAVASKIMRREVHPPESSFAHGLKPPIFSLAMWVTNGIAFYLFVDSVVPTSPTQLLAFIAMNAGAYWIGYASFITPSGLGFREGVLAWMLGSFMPAPVAVVLSLAARLWSSGGELLGVAVVYILQPKESDEPVV
ncbi:MAG: flippase-like domain-containing protein [Chloroflexi bacterium]|nr:flippase-like domain-containing protein [Chloroflexota bacterium]